MLKKLKEKIPKKEAQIREKAMRYLFTDFLTDKKLYKACQNYWEAKIEYLLKKKGIIKPKTYLNTKFANG